MVCFCLAAALIYYLITIRRENEQKDYAVVMKEASDAGYTINNILSTKRVPRIFKEKMVSNLHEIENVNDRKRLFIKVTLPLILKVNEEVLEERARLERIEKMIAENKRVPSEDQEFLKTLNTKYNETSGDIKALKAKIDIIPPSLALAQAIQETGWGTSRFAQKAQALFGEWTMKEEGILPKDRDEDKNHRIRKFNSMEESIRAYVTNLNSQRAYRRFRAARKAMRDNCKELDSIELAGYMTYYSEQKQLYINKIVNIMKSNQLTKFDELRLHDSEFAFEYSEECKEKEKKAKAAAAKKKAQAAKAAKKDGKGTAKK